MDQHKSPLRISYGAIVDGHWVQEPELNAKQVDFWNNVRLVFGMPTTLVLHLHLGCIHIDLLTL